MQLQPPAPVVTLVYFGPAALIDLTNMDQATSDPRSPHIHPAMSLRAKKGFGVLIDGCPAVQLPPSTTSLVRGAMARPALANFMAALYYV
jgi:hypothetical protein